MHTTLTTVQSHLRKLITQIQSAVPNEEPLGVAHGSWNLPGLTRAEFIEAAQSLIDLIDDRGADEIESAADARLQDYGRRLDFLCASTVGQFWGGNGGQAASAYMLTLDGLRKALEPALTRDDHAEAVTTLRSLTTKLRGMEAKLNGLDPRTASLATMVERIAARQGSCRLVHAASGCFSSVAECVLTTASRSGFNVTAPTGVQLRVAPDQRRGLRWRAWQYSSWRAARIALSSPA